MAKLLCLCGNQLSNVTSPNQIEGYLLTDLDIDRMDNDKLSSLEIMDLARDVWECSECGRLAFNHPGKHDSSVKWYKPEDGKYGGLNKNRDLWKCRKCKKITDRLDICWAESGGKKVDIIEYFCVYCGHTELDFIGTKQEEDEWWDNEQEK